MCKKALLFFLGVVTVALATLLSCAPPGATTARAPADATPGWQVGNLAPGFSLVDINGQSVRLSDFRGKPVLINFWATWCPPCRQEMPYLQQVYDQWSAKGLVLLAINIEESPAKVKTFFAENNLSLPVLFDFTGSVTDSYGVIPIPTTFFIDGDGVIRQRVVGAFPNRQAIEKELKKIMP
jgi:peroxiredoxin